MGRVDWWSLSDEELERQCQRDHYRARGPGGQHRNKTDSAVRLRHGPTGLVVTATERRSQHENRVRALARLREALAYQHRQPLEDEATTPVASAWVQGGKLDLGRKDRRFLPAMAYVLDVVAACQGRLADAAGRLGVSTANLVKFLQSTPESWMAVQRLRDQFSLPRLRS